MEDFLNLLDLFWSIRLVRSPLKTFGQERQTWKVIGRTTRHIQTDQADLFLPVLRKLAKQSCPLGTAFRAILGDVFNFKMPFSPDKTAASAASMLISLAAALDYNFFFLVFPRAFSNSLAQPLLALVPPTPLSLSKADRLWNPLKL